MKAKEFVDKLVNIARNYKTLYVMGCFGAPMTEANKRRYTQNHPYNKQAARTAMINAASADTFGFDCVCLIKGVLWGWNGDATALITNLPQIILTIVQALPQIITSIVNTLVSNIPKIIETGVKLLTSLITNLPQVIAELVRAMPQIITSMVNALGQGVSQFAEIGGNLVRGLWNGIQSLAGWLWDKVSGWISSIWDGICDFFGIASPSKKMAWVSEMNVEGAAVGVEKNKGKAVKAYGNMTAEMLAEVEGGMSKVNASLADSIGEIETGFSTKATIEQVAASVPSLTDERSRAAVSGGGDTTVTNHFHIAELVVREEADVKKISRELYNMQKAKSRGKGVV